MLKLTVSLVVGSLIAVAVIGTLGLHFLKEELWLNAMLTVGKAIIGYGFFVGDEAAKINALMAWSVVIFITISGIVGTRDKEAYLRKRDRESRLRSVDIVCAKCDQYLGTAAGFSSPCPRCGSNRYRKE